MIISMKKTTAPLFAYVLVIRISYKLRYRLGSNETNKSFSFHRF